MCLDFRFMELVIISAKKPLLNREVFNAKLQTNFKVKKEKGKWLPNGMPGGLIFNKVIKDLAIRVIL